MGFPPKSSHIRFAISVLCIQSVEVGKENTEKRRAIICGEKQLETQVKAEQFE